MKYLLLLSLALICVKATCQEKYIEVTVTDTAWVTPNQFVYVIMPILAAEDVINYAASDSSPSKKEKSKADVSRANLLIDSLQDVFAKKGFHILSQDIKTGFFTYNETKFNLIRVFTTSIDSIEAVYKLIEKNINFYGFIASVKAKDEEVYRKKLSQKLITIAKDKVARIAALRNLKTGNIISVKDVTKKEPGWTAYPPLSGLERSTTPGWHATLYPNNNYKNSQYPIQNSFVVRFAAQ